MFGGIREGRGYAIAFGAGSLIIGAIMAFEPMTGALSLTLLVVFWLGLRGLLELAWAIRSPAHRGWMIALGILNLLLALLVLATIRSEDRRVGKECGSTCRSRWETYHERQKTQHEKLIHI